MKLESRQVIEVVGILAVVLSLIFVGLQLILDRNVAETEIYANRAESLKSDYRAQLESEFYIGLQVKDWERGIRPVWWTEELDRYKEDAGYTNTDMVVQILAYEIIALHYDNVYFQYNQGLLAEGSWERFRVALEARISDPLQQAVFMFRQRGLSDVLEDMLSRVQ